MVFGTIRWVFERREKVKSEGSFYFAKAFFDFCNMSPLFLEVVAIFCRFWGLQLLDFVQFIVCKLSECFALLGHKEMWKFFFSYSFLLDLLQKISILSKGKNSFALHEACKPSGTAMLANLRVCNCRKHRVNEITLNFISLFTVC